MTLEGKEKRIAHRVLDVRVLAVAVEFVIDGKSHWQCYIGAITEGAGSLWKEGGVLYQYRICNSGSKVVESIAHAIFPNSPWKEMKYLEVEQ